MSIIGLTFLFGGVVTSLLLGIVLLVSQRRSKMNIWLSMVSVMSGLWTLGIVLFLVHPDMQLSGWYVRGYYLAAIFIPFALYYFLHYFPYTVAFSKIEQTLTIFLVLLAAGTIMTPGALLHIVPGPSGAKVQLNDTGYSLYVVVFLSLALASLFMALSGYRYVRKRGEVVLARQARGVIAVAIMALTGGMVFNLFLPALGNYDLIWAGPPFAAFFTVYIFYIIIQQGMFDVRAALARAVAYMLMLGVTVFVYTAALFASSEILFPESEVGRLQLLFYVLLAVILMISARPLRRLLDRFTHSIFYRSDYDSQKTLQEITRITSSEIELRELVRRSVNVLCHSIQPEYGSLFVFSSSGKTYHYGKNLSGKRMHQRYRRQLAIIEDRLGELPQLVRSNDVVSFEERKMLDGADAAVVVQLTLRGEHLGVLFLGERKSGERYNDDDMQLLRLAADELALAVQNALRFEEIQKFNQRLRDEVSRATRDLRRSNRQLHHLDEVKNDFLSIASHQLRTPLTSVKGYISMVLDGDAGEVTTEQRKLLEEAFVSSQRMVALIEDFLNVSRLQTGRFSIDCQPVDIRSIVKEEVDTLRSTAANRSLTLQLVIGKNIPDSILVDKSKIRQVVMNLIDNAIYYSLPNQRIQVRLSREGGDIRFAVHDKGIGVPKKEQARLFTRFYRANNARKRRPDGTGVGLYLAKRVIDEHGGSMIFRSTEGEGSTFGFVLPIKLPEKEAASE